MKLNKFWPIIAALFLVGIAFTMVVDNEFYFYATYAVMQLMIMGIAWNILGGFTGYVNFGSGGFFAVGAYTTVFLHRAFDAPPLLIAVLVAPIVSGLIGLGVGYFTLRLKGVYFAIATLAVAIILETIVVNWEFVGGAGGYYLLIPEDVVFFDSYIEWLFVLILAITLIAIIVSRYLNSSKIGQGLAAIRDDELAAECMGVPTLKLKLISTTVMGGLMGAAGAPFPYFITFVEPASAFNLLVAVMAIAVPMIGGTASWIGPVIGGLLLGTIQETVTVNISSELNLLIVGVVLVGFISLAPQGITGLCQDFIHFIRKRRKGNG